VGIIDTVHLVEVARAIEVLEDSQVLSAAELKLLRQWFADYLRWMTTDPYGIDEREAKNNHGTCWVLQVAAFSTLTGNQELLLYCKERYKNVLVPNQIAANGSFPQELRRTKPYSYSLFNLEGLAAICQLLSTPKENLWTFELPDGRGIRRAMEFMLPYIRDKTKWPYPPDVMYYEHWPMRQNSLLFGGVALGRSDLVEIWKKLPADSSVDEIVRNFFIRQPVLWVGENAALTKSLGAAQIALNPKAFLAVRHPMRRETDLIKILTGIWIMIAILALRSNANAQSNLEQLSKMRFVARVDFECANKKYPKQRLSRLVREAMKDLDADISVYGNSAFGFDLNKDGKLEYFIPLDCGVSNCMWEYLRSIRRDSWRKSLRKKFISSAAAVGRLSLLTFTPAQMTASFRSTNILRATGT
jgi:hypothetical protein